MSASDHREYGRYTTDEVRTQLRSPWKMGRSMVWTRRRACAIPLICLCSQQTTRRMGGSILTIFKIFNCVPDRNTSRRVPRLGFAFTRYLDPHVRWSRAGHPCELTRHPRTVCRNHIKVAPEAGCLPNDVVLDPSPTAYSRCRSPV